MILDKISSKGFFYFSLIANCILIVSAYVDASTFNIDNLWFSTDPLYLPSLYKDLFIDKYHLEGWLLNPSPNFFPDIFLFFSLNAILPNFIWAALGFSIIQYLFIIFLFYHLLKTLEIPDRYLYLNISTLFSSLFFLSQVISNDFDFAFFMMINSYHMGSFVNSLAAIITGLAYLKKSKKITALFFCLIVLVGTVSDKLFIVSFSIPMTFVCLILLLLKEKKKSTLLLLQIVPTTIAALFILNRIKESTSFHLDEPYRILSFQDILPSFDIWQKQMMEYISLFHIKSFIILLCVLSFGFLIFYLIKNKRQITEKNLNYTQPNLLTIYFLFSFLFFLIVLFTPILNGSYPSGDNIRYNFSVFVISILNLGLFFSVGRVYEIKFIKHGFNFIGILLFIYASYFLINHKEELHERMAYYPKKVRIVDELLKDKNVNAGVADYWDAKVITMFSKNNLRVYPAFNELSIYKHSANINWFYIKPGSQNKESQIFNFIIFCKDWQSELPTTIVPPDHETLEKEGVKIIITNPFKYPAQKYDPVPCAE